MVSIEGEKRSRKDMMISLAGVVLVVACGAAIFVKLSESFNVSASTEKSLKINVNRVPIVTLERLKDSLRFFQRYSAGVNVDVVNGKKVAGTNGEDLAACNGQSSELNCLQTPKPCCYLPGQFRVSIPRIPSRIRFKESVSKESRSRVTLDGGLYSYALEAFASTKNMTIFAFPSTGGGTGLPIPNTTRWSGIVGDLMEDLADLGVNTAITYSRHRVVDFSYPVELQEIAFVVSKPSRIYSWKTILWPFQTSFWFILGIFSALIVIVLSRMPKDEYMRQGSLTTELVGTEESILYILRGLLEQSCGIQKSGYARVVCILWLILTLNVAAVYKTRFFELLTFPITDHAPRTFEELAESDYTNALHFNGGAAYHLIKTSSKPALVKMMKKNLERINDPTKCYENIMRIKKYSCSAWLGIIEYVVGTNMSDKYGNGPFILSKAPAIVTPLGFSMQKASPLAEPLNKFVLGAANGGLFRVWLDLDISTMRLERNKMWRRNNITATTYDIDQVGMVSMLSMNHLQGCFAVWVVGIFAALLAVATEYLMSKCIRVRRLQRAAVSRSLFQESTARKIVGYTV